MIRTKDVLVVLALAWFFRKKTETSVSLKQTCIYPDGSTVMVPLGDACPVGSVLLTESPPYVPPIGDGEFMPQVRGYLGGCGCENCEGC